MTSHKPLTCEWGVTSCPEVMWHVIQLWQKSVWIGLSQMKCGMCFSQAVYINSHRPACNLPHTEIPCNCVWDCLFMSRVYVMIGCYGCYQMWSLLFLKMSASADLSLIETFSLTSFRAVQLDFTFNRLMRKTTITCVNCFALRTFPGILAKRLVVCKEFE